MNIIVNDNTPEFQSWLAGAAKIVADDYAANFPSLTPSTLRADFGSRYAKIIRTTWHKDGSGVINKNQDSVHAFIDRTNGDVLKPASWKAPAKHNRGNIFGFANGLGTMGPYGPAYLRG
jgi:hypothetical protein